MVRTLERLCHDGDRIGELSIVGHGTEQGQFVGSDFVTLKTLPQHRSELLKITRLFSRGAGSNSMPHVIMAGCRQGRNPQLLLALSNLWNVRVSGFTAMQRNLLGPLGGRTTCYIECTRQGYTLADDIDEIQLKLMRLFR